MADELEKLEALLAGLGGRALFFGMARNASERQRRWRERRRRGVRVVAVEVSPELLDALLDRGLIDPDDPDNSSDLSFSLGLLLEEIAGGVD